MRSIGRLAGILFVFGILSAPEAHAKLYGPAGCGMGSMLMGPSGNQVFAGTTNVSFGSQFFGIISGTSNCKPSKQMAAEMRQQEFLAANLASLQKELAQGSGDTVAAFVDVLGCDSSVLSEAQETLVGRYQELFKVPGIDGVLEKAKFELNKNPNLAKQCEFLG